MKGPEWKIVNNLLKLSLPDDTHVTPTAREIYGAEFSDEKMIKGLEVGKRPTESIPELNASRYPVDLYIRIEIDTECPQPLKMICNVYGICKDIDIQIPDFLMHDADHIVAGNTWFPFPTGSSEQIRKILNSCNVHATGSISLGQYLDLLNNSEKSVRILDCTRDAAHAARAHSDDVPIPKLFVGKMYPYQLAGYYWLTTIANENLGCILSDEMGLGKTIQIIALMASRISGEKGISLIVVPATLLENWRREIRKFAPAIKPLIHQGAYRTAFLEELESYDVIISSYDTVIRDRLLMEMISWDMIILDEAQAIKNPDAKRSACVKSLKRRVAIAVTGTPVENSLTDLWSIMDFSLPGFLEPLDSFSTRYQSDDPDHASSLEPLISPLILRRTVNEVASDLPEKIIIPQAISMSPEMVEEYEYIRNGTIEEYGARGSLVALIRLRMFCCHPILLNGGKSDPADNNTKYQRLCEIISELTGNGEKALIFTSFSEMVNIISDDLHNRLCVFTDFIDGRIAVNKRQEKIDIFSQQNGSAILVLNPKAAGTGLNITSANHVIHYNLEWNPAVEDQASARAYRRGQTRPVTIHRLFYADTVEDVIDQRVEQKRHLAETVIVGTDGTTDQHDMMRALNITPFRSSADEQS